MKNQITNTEHNGLYYPQLISLFIGEKRIENYYVQAVILHHINDQTPDHSRAVITGNGTEGEGTVGNLGSEGGGVDLPGMQSFYVTCSRGEITRAVTLQQLQKLQ